MHRRILARLFALVLGITSNSALLATNHDDNPEWILEAISSILASFPQRKPETCKILTYEEHKTELLCGLPNSDYVDNFFVFYVDEKKYGKKPNVSDMFFILENVFDNAEQACKASYERLATVEKKEVTFQHLPKSVQDKIEVKPGKIAVYMRARIRYGAPNKYLLLRKVALKCRPKIGSN